MFVFFEECFNCFFFCEFFPSAVDEKATAAAVCKDDLFDFELDGIAVCAKGSLFDILAAFDAEHGGKRRGFV